MPYPKQLNLPPRPREERDLTKLGINESQIMAILKATPGYRPPRPMNPNRPPSNKFCDFHEDVGHTTERCYRLKNLIKDKIQNGELAYFAVIEEPPNQQ